MDELNVNNSRQPVMARIPYIDIAKGLGILLVVFGHNSYLISEKGELYNIIFSFHMPLFFFLSGLFFNTEKNLKIVALDRADSLLKPYFVVLFSVSFLYIYFKGASSLGYFVGVFYGNGATIPWTPLWFLPHLWAVCVFSYIFVKITGFSRISLHKKLLFLLLLLVGGFLTIGSLYKIQVSFGTNIKEVFGQTGSLPGLPFSLDILLLSAVFFLSGFVFKEYLVSFRVSYLYIALCALVFGFLHVLFDHTIDFNLRRYDHIFISTLEAVLGIYIVLTISLHIPKNYRIGKLLARIGSASIFILIFHRFFQDNVFNYLNTLFKDLMYVNGIIAFFAGFIGPMIIRYIVKSNNYFALFWLPLKHNPLIQMRHNHLNKESRT